jgi:ACS family D-galactonate transporter-like MFS transporter
MINYLDRTVLGLAAPSLRADPGIDAATMGWVFSAFGRTYAAMQIPGGIFLDRFGVRVIYFPSVTFWSLFTWLQGFTTGLAALLLFRFLACRRPLGSVS